MLHLSTLDTTTLELLRKLQSIPALCKTRLVGDTALALQIGHRKSIDLDFFGKIEVEKDELVIALEQIGALTVLKESPRIHIYLLNNVKIDIVDYQYSWVDDVVVKQGIRMASLKDIAAMKSLAYFDDAEEDIMPYMLTDITWENIKQQILSNIF